MNHIHFIVSAILAMLGMIAPAMAAAEKSVDGEALHQQACTSCHGTEVYERSDHKIHSMEGLQAQVQRCAHAATGVDWSEAQRQAVVQYLNDSFYHFD